MKKISLLALVLALFFTPILSQADFTDSEDSYDYIYDTHGDFEAALYLQEEDIVDGYDDGTFKPLSTINRAEFTKIVLNATHPDAVGGSDCFTDVSEEWFAPYVCSAKTLGIIDGYSDGSFKPSANVNFAEASKILSNAFGLESTSGDGAWYEGYVNAMNEKEYFPTYAPGVSFAVQRGEMARMIYNFLTGESESTLSPSKDAKGNIGITITGAGGSCWFFQIQDVDRNAVSVPTEVEEVMGDCGSEVKFLSDDGRYLYYVKADWSTSNGVSAARDFKVYDFTDGSTSSLVSFYDTTENVSSITWTEDMSRFALVVINFEATDYPTHTKLFVLDVEGETVVSKEKYDVSIPYSCSANGPCYSLSSPEWIDENTVEFYSCEETASAEWDYEYPWTIEDLSTVEGCEETALDV